MGPRGSAVLGGHTTYHKMVEEELAELKKKEVNSYSRSTTPKLLPHALCSGGPFRLTQLRVSSGAAIVCDF